MKPSIDEIAAAIAQKDKARIIPSCLTALNKLGLSTQVTMNAVYLTDATAREIKIGNRTIMFKRCAPRNFAYQTEVFPLVVCAMKEIGAANVTEEHIDMIKNAIDKCEDKDAIRHDYNVAPSWIRKKTLYMMKAWTNLTKEERQTILTNIADEKGIVENVVEKDYWVSMTLRI